MILGRGEETGCLQKDLNSAMSWSIANNMQLHEDNFELSFHKANIRSDLVYLPFTIKSYNYSVSDDKIFYPANQLKDLGVVVSVYHPIYHGLHITLTRVSNALYITHVIHDNYYHV